MLCYVMLPPSNRWMYCQYWGHADSFNQIHPKNLGATHSKQQRLHPEKGITKQRTKNKKIKGPDPHINIEQDPHICKSGAARGIQLYTIVITL